MRLLLDTHVLLWWLDDPALLSSEARAAIRSGRNTVYVSAAAVWEIVIKQALGKLSIPNDLDEVLESNRFAALPISTRHALTLRSLPKLHSDPFDRMLIAQSISEELTLVTRDPHIRRYPVLQLLG